MAVKALSPNPWTTREFPSSVFFKLKKKNQNPKLAFLFAFVSAPPITLPEVRHRLCSHPLNWQAVRCSQCPLLFGPESLFKLGLFPRLDPLPWCAGSLNSDAGLCLVAQLFLTLCHPRDCSPSGSFWDFPGKNTGVGCRALLQGIFPTQGQTQVSCIVGGFLTD